MNRKWPKVLSSVAIRVDSRDWRAIFFDLGLARAGRAQSRFQNESRLR